MHSRFAPLLEILGAFGLVATCAGITALLGILIGPAAAYCIGAVWLALIAYGLADMLRIDSGFSARRVGGIYFLRFYRLRFSFCISRK